MIKNVSVSGSETTFSIVCASPSGQSCRENVVGSTVERRQGRQVVAVVAPGLTGTNTKRAAAARVALTGSRRKVHGGKPKTKTIEVTVAQGSFTVPGGGTLTAKIKLNRSGKRLLARFQRLPVGLSFTGSITATRAVVFALPRPHVKTPPDSWFNIGLPCSGSQCYSMPNNVPITGLPLQTRISVTCVGPGCPFRHGSFKARKHQFDLAWPCTTTSFSPGQSLPS